MKTLKRAEVKAIRMLLEGLGESDFSGTSWVSTFFPAEEDRVEEQRNNLPRQVANSEAQVLRTSRLIPSRPQDFLDLSSVKAEIISFDEITKLGIKVNSSGIRLNWK